MNTTLSTFSDDQDIANIMTDVDSEFDFDCPQFSYELSAIVNRSEDLADQIDPWFLTYHVDHDWKRPSHLDVERSNQTKPANFAVAKGISSNLGPARSAKRMSTTSSVPSSSQNASLSSRRGSQRSDELKADDSKQCTKEKSSQSAALKRKSVTEVDDPDAGQANSATDMRDKLDEFKQRRRKEIGTESLATLSIPKSVIPPTDYSRSKLLTADPIRSESSASSTAAKLLLAKKLTSGVNKTSTGLQNKTTATIGGSSSSVRAVPAQLLSSASTTAAAARLITRSSTAPASNKIGTTGNIKNPVTTDSKTVNKKTVIDDETSMVELLKKHNQRFAPIPIYEPSRHSVRDVRKWEKSSGKTWSSLRPEEREVANAEIGRAKELALKESQK